MSDIFIGYRRHDGGHARAIYEGLCYWYDAAQVFLDHESLPPGAKFRDELGVAIEGCRVFLAVIGPHWLSPENHARLQDPDDITRGEIRSALQHRKPIIPILAGGAGFPNSSALPEDIRSMQEANAHHQLEAQYHASFQDLLEVLKTRHGLKPVFRRRDGSPQPFRLIDLPLSNNFVDPAGHLPELHKTLADQGAAAVIAAATVHGMGGVGKTQLALKYSHAWRAEYAGVWWFRAENNGQLELDCQEFCSELGCPPRDGELPHQAVKRWLQSQPRWLLVYDNAENKHDLAGFLPSVGGHHLLITSRDRDWDEIAQPLALDVWTDEQALEFLRRRLENAGDNEHRQLAHALGGLPLALEQACAYILKQRIGIADYCREVENWQRANPLLDRKDAVGYPYSVLTTLSLAFAKLTPAAQQLLRLCAWFAPEAIPERLFREHTELLPEALQAAAKDELAWAETAAQLESHALLQRGTIPALDRQPGETREEPAFTLHRLTQEAVRAKLADKANDCAVTVELLRAAYPSDTLLPSNWPTCATLLSHVRRLQDFHPHGWVAPRPLTWLMDSAAAYLQYGPALYREAVELFRAALGIAVADLGEEHPDTLTVMNNLAGTLRAQGDLLGARTLQEKVRDIRHRVLGEEHPDTLTAMNNLAHTLWTQDDLPGARVLEEKVLDIRRRLLGEEHHDTLITMGNLAATLKAQGDLPGARILQEKVLGIRNRLLGEEHPDTLIAMNNLAVTLKAQGYLPDARALEEKALEIRRRVLGEEHPSTSISAFNLFATLLKMQETAAAHALFRDHLAWLLQRDPASLGADQRDIREQLHKFFSNTGFPPP